jgi:hypothetical protein
MRQILSSQEAASRSPFSAPPKFEAVYSVRPFVEEPNVTRFPFSLPAPVAVPGDL